MEYWIYQVRDARIRDVGFRSFDPARKVVRSDYHETYQGLLRDEMGDDDALNHLFRKFNMDRPADFRSYSLSMADVVVLDDRAYYCDTAGWRRLHAGDVQGPFTLEK